MSLSKDELILIANQGREEFEERIWDEDSDALIKTFEKKLNTFGAKLANNWGLSLEDFYNYDQHIHNHMISSAKEAGLEPFHFIKMCIAYKTL